MRFLSGQPVVVPASNYIGHDLCAAPQRELRHIFQRETKNRRHGALRQRAGKGLHEIDLRGPVPVCNQLIAMRRYHGRVAAGARPYPRIRQLLAVGAPEIGGGAQRDDGLHHCIKIGHFARHAASRDDLAHQQIKQGREARPVFHNPGNIGVAGQNVSVIFRGQPLAGNAAHRRLRMEDSVSRIPMLRRIRCEQINIIQRLRAGLRAAGVCYLLSPSGKAITLSNRPVSVRWLP